MKLFKSIKSTILVYCVLVVILAGLLTIGLIFNIWELVACFGIAAFFDLFVLMILLFQVGLDTSSTDKKTMLKITAFNVIRFLLIALGVGGALLVLRLTQTENKFRYLFSLISLLPLLVSFGVFYLNLRNRQ